MYSPATRSADKASCYDKALRTAQEMFRQDIDVASLPFHRAKRSVVSLVVATGLALGIEDSMAQGAEDHQAMHSFPNDGSAVLTTVFRGRKLTYQVVEGMAVHGRDMVLGTAEEAATASNAPLAPRSGAKQVLTPKHASATTSEFLWPDGVIPYEVDPKVYSISPEQRRHIDAAVESWNKETIIRLVPKSGQSDYVRIIPASDGFCRANVGRRRGESNIWIRPGGCDESSMVHEIGHIVGLWHEHERKDRDEYIMLIDENLSVSFDYGSWMATLPTFGPYNYSSAMHYGLTYDGQEKRVFDTIPPGMPVPSGGLSPGDIDAVARLYGKPPTIVTLSTNPPGLELIVDGIARTTPVSIHWLPGTQHSLEAPVVQSPGLNDRRYVFGRWSDAIERTRQITVSPNVTWFEANYIEQIRPSVRIHGGWDAGRVTLEPESPDGYYTVRSRVKATAIALPSRQSPFDFWYWSTGRWLKHGGQSTNPITLDIHSGLSGIDAHFTTFPIFRVRSNFERGARVYIDGIEMQLPLNIRAKAPCFLCVSSYWTEAPEVTWRFPDTDRKLRFRSRNDGRERADWLEFQLDYSVMAGVYRDIAVVRADAVFLAEALEAGEDDTIPWILALNRWPENRLQRLRLGAEIHPEASAISLLDLLWVDAIAALRRLLGARWKPPEDSFSTQRGDDINDFFEQMDEILNTLSEALDEEYPPFMLEMSEDIKLAIEVEGNGSVEIYPPSSDGFHPIGTEVQLLARPDPGWEFSHWTEDATGTSLRKTVSMTAPHRVGTVFVARTSRLVPGTAKSFRKDRNNFSWQLFSGEDGYRVWVSQEATELSVSLDVSTLGVEIDLYIRHGSDIVSVYNFADEAQYASSRLGGNEELRITRQSDPPLRPGLYYIALVSRTPNRSFEGSILAEVRGNAPPTPELAVFPRAYTFITAPGFNPTSQTVQLRNTGRSDLQYRLTAPPSGLSWLRADRGEGLVTSGTTAKIQLGTTPFGLQPGSHHRTKICVTWARPGEIPIPAPIRACSGKEIDLTLVVLPKQY